MKSQIHTINSQHFEVVFYGPESGQPVLFFHGFGASANCLPIEDELLTQLGLRIIAVNRPGTGQSTFWHPLSVYDLVQPIYQLTKELKLGKLILIGWSAGGLFAQAFASCYPESVKQLTLISSAIPFHNASSRPLLPMKWKLISRVNRLLPALTKQVMAHGQLRRNLDRLIQRSVRELPAADQQVLAKGQYERFNQSTLESYGEKGLGPFFDTQALCAKQEIWLEEIKAPTLIWHGGQDTVWPVHFAHYLHKQITNAQLRILNNDGHLLYLKTWEKILSEALHQSTPTLLTASVT